MTRSRWTCFLLVVLSLLVTRLPLLWEPLIHVDEAIFSIFAEIWQRGGIPYVDIIETKPMGIYYFYVLASWLSGSLPKINMISVHVLTIVWTLLTAATLGMIATRLRSSQAGFIAALFFVVFSGSFSPKIVSTSLEVVLILPATLAIFFLSPPISRLSLWHTVVAGLLSSSALLVKQQGGILIPVALFYLAVYLPWVEPEWCWKRAIQHSLTFLLASFPLPCLMMGQLYPASLDGFLFWNFQGSWNLIRGGQETISLGHKFLTRIFPFLLSTALLWFLVGERFYQRISRKLHATPQETLLWLWLFLTFFAVAAGKKFYEHYFVLLFPPLSLLAAIALDSWSPERKQRFKKVIMIAILAPFLGFSLARYFIHPLFSYFKQEDMISYKIYGDYLRERTEPDDKILVWGFAPAVYWYADRLPATRFVLSDYLVGRVPGALEGPTQIERSERFVMPEAWEMLMADLHKHPPAYIMDTAPTGLHGYSRFPIRNYPEVMEFIKRHYVEEPAYQEASIWRLATLR
ncbi:MAG: hypothetical protein HYW02_01385 [Deltaproteobacteria bacterium]|nr:hypothetical protein [Deltaproteobacteria bacterium]